MYISTSWSDFGLIEVYFNYYYNSSGSYQVVYYLYIYKNQVFIGRVKDPLT